MSFINKTHLFQLNLQENFESKLGSYFLILEDLPD